MAGSVFNTRGVSNTGDSVIIGPTNSARVGERERNRNINLDVQDMRSQAAMKARAAAQAEKEANDLLKPDVADAGRFQNPFNTQFVQPHLAEMADLKRKNQLLNNRATVYEKAGKLKTVGQSLANANKAVENVISQTSATYPKIYDPALFDAAITKEAQDRIMKGEVIGPAEIQEIAERVRDSTLNAPQIYQDFIDQTKGNERVQSFTADPTGLFSTSQTLKVNPYLNINKMMGKKGEFLGYEGRLAKERIYYDQMNNPRTKRLYEINKANQLKNADLMKAYQTDLAKAAEETDPNKKQDQIAELEYNYFIEPFMPKADTWAMQNLDEKQIKKFVQARSLTDREREIRQASKTAFQEAENRVGADGRTKSKQNSFAGTFTKDDAAGIVIGSPYIMVMVDGKLQKVPNPGIKQGVGQTYRVTSENIIRGGGLMVMGPGSTTAQSLDPDFFLKKPGDKTTWKKIKTQPTYFQKNGFMEGEQFDADLMNQAIEIAKKKGYKPVTLGPNGKYVPVNEAADFVVAGRVKPEPFMELDISELQAKEDDATPIINTEGNPVSQALSIFFKGPGRSGKIYTPLTQAGTAKAAAMKYNPAFMQTVQELDKKQRELNLNMFVGSEEGEQKPKPASTTPKPRTRF